MAVDSGQVWWADEGDGSLRRASSAGGPVTVLASGEALVAGAPIAVDTQSVYWLATAPPTVTVRAVAR